jgi:hypothetical protein
MGNNQPNALCCVRKQFNLESNLNEPLDLNYGNKNKTRKRSIRMMKESNCGKSIDSG